MKMMKKISKLSLAVLFCSVLFCSLVFIGCDDPLDEEGEAVEYADLLGTWNHKTKGTSIVISEGTIKELNDKGEELFEAEINSYKAETNTAQNSSVYPGGFSFDVTVTKTSSNANTVGSTKKYFMLLNTNKKSFLTGTSVALANVEYLKTRDLSEANEKGIVIGDFYKTWGYDGYAGDSLTLSAAELTESGSSVYKAKFIRVTEAENVDTNKGDYPSGFLFVYEVTQSSDTAYKVGTRYVYRLFMHKSEKTKIEQVLYNSNGTYNTSYFLTSQGN